ncbi:MAG: hypothetical protein EON90_04160 [Brevundimonas sp.]|nr:MAG: hypothetical protein EON90_04160 [Brevundimonas sp.]
MFDTLPAQIFAAVGLLICGFAFVKGGPAERTFAGVYVLSWLATLVLQTQTSREVFPWALFAVDCVMLVIYAGLSWKYRVAWPVWATALQALAVVSHIMNLFVVGPSSTAFFTVLNITAYGILVALAVGTFWAWQERRAAGLE